MVYTTASGQQDARPYENITNSITIADLKRAIPAHCFQPSYSRSLFYLFRDYFVVAILASSAWLYIPRLPYTIARYIAWIIYGYMQGLVYTGLWVQAHECGHGAFSPSRILNDTIGLLTHSFLLVPYYGWRSTHHRHHLYANNLAKDHNYVPPVLTEYLSARNIETIDELTQDAPFSTLLRLLIHQALGLLIYFLTNMTASRGSYIRAPSNHFLGNSHIYPYSSIFHGSEAPFILLSDIGILTMLYLLWKLTSSIGLSMVAFLYIHPYVWCNHWIVGITYLHHTDPKLPKYSSTSWTFVRGTLATMDRRRGWVGKHFLHNIADYHVVHHLFPRIPHYHTPEATAAIAPLLGTNYHCTDQSFVSSLWASFSQCRWVEADESVASDKQVYWYKPGARTASEKQ
ncbi:delta-12 fatty acid desaturas-like protein [Lojkania enalia]|uniref:Delta-12 fatty acid desaturas-like protein n=1 Tax=Lojkania enalia TaxID=147567 RepID=A0A9P4N907_9PLEO|nr:delta-12 fatty acid desaturas-like protein [Didymosphaeria enalia]